MVWPAALFCLLLAAVASVLLWRVQHAIRAAQVLLSPQGHSHPDLLAVEGLVRTAFDEGLTPALRQPDLTGFELTHREHQDPYQNLAELLSWIRRNAGAEKQAQVEEVIKATCQLTFTLQQSPAALEVCLHPFAARLQRLLAQGRGEVKIVYVQPGELIETSRMLPLSYGSRVQYPLGVIVLDATGRVLSKARVLSV